MVVGTILGNPHICIFFLNVFFFVSAPPGVFQLEALMEHFSASTDSKMGKGRLVAEDTRLKMNMIITLLGTQMSHEKYPGWLG